MALSIRNHKFVEGDNVRHELTKKHGGAITPKFIVMHFTAGWTTSGDLATLNGKNTKVSCQLLVGRDGEIIQMVPFNKRAWHAGPSRMHGYKDLNSHSIGIEFTNIGPLKKTGDDAWADNYGHTLDAQGNFRGSSRKMECSIPIDQWLVAKHKNLGSRDHYWEPYTEAQLQAGDDIVNALVAKYPTIKYVVGHDDIDTRGWKNDPGPAFPLRRFQRLIEDRGSAASPEIGESLLRVSNVTRMKTTANLNVRSMPDWSSDKITVVPVGTRVEVSDVNGYWMFAKYTNADGRVITGWLYSNYLERLF